MSRAKSSAQDLFSTYQIAQLLSVDIGSVIQWMNQGRLQGYRTPGGHRRVRRNELFAFLKAYDMPVPESLNRDKKVVLLVEDEALIRLDLRRVIESLKIPNLQIEEAEDGYQAGRKIARFKPALVVLDVRLPGVDGFQICRDLRDQHGPEETRVLVVSGQLSAASERERIMQAGADDVMSKPVDLELFKAKVRKFLGKELAHAKSVN